MLDLVVLCVVMRYFFGPLPSGLVITKGRNGAMNRRSFLTRTGAIAGVAATVPAPAIAQGVRELKMVTSSPKGLPGLGSSAERLGRAITAMTGGRLKVEVLGAGD